MKIIVDIPENLYEAIGSERIPLNVVFDIINCIRTGRVIPTDICSCWEDYPNKNHKFKNGKWKCVDCYENIDNAQGYKRKTHCRRVTTNERNTIPGNDTIEPEDKKEQSTDCL